VDEEAVCILCGMSLQKDAVLWLAAASRVRPGGSVCAAHPDCLVAAANNPNLASLGLLVDESAAAARYELTPGAKHLYVGAVAVAREFGHHFIGTEHLLLAMVRQPDGSAGRTLEELTGRERIDRRLVERLGSDGYNSSRSRADEA
jgi:hypothetical protein